MSEEKPKEGVKTGNDPINLKVAGQVGCQLKLVEFKIKRHMPLSKLMKAYCETQGLSIREIRFMFDGKPINETDTPAQLKMEDEDTIDVFHQQIKEGVKTGNYPINLKVVGQDGKVVKVIIRRHFPLSRLMKAYCERQGLSIREIWFMFDGKLINETDTPAQLKMEDEDTIDVFHQQIKEGVKTGNYPINLKVVGQDGKVVKVIIRRHFPLSRLMKAYCERQGLSIREIWFMFDGKLINETDTPAQLKMEDEDTIDVFQQQIKEGVKTGNDPINLKVVGQDGKVVKVIIRRHFPLSRLMKAYCERQGLSIRHIWFMFDGKLINETDTPAQLGMEDEDTIYAIEQQINLKMEDEDTIYAFQQQINVFSI